MDRLAEAQGVSVESLMHEAGRAVAACALEHNPKAERIAVLCGKGNNGGDGLVAARFLAEHQRKIEVLVAASRSELNANAQRELGRLREPGITPVFAPDRDWEARLQDLSSADLLIDALLGTGAKGAPADAVEAAIHAINQSSRPVLAVDIPSGIDADTGEAAGEYVRADRTVTFGLRKPFVYQGDGMLAAGKFEVAPIGFPDSLLETPRGALAFGFQEARALMPARDRDAHKGSEGHVLIVAGHHAMPGAAFLAAKGALRAGAGLVTVAAIPPVCRIVAGQLPEAIFVPLPEEEGVLGLSAKEAILQASQQADALVIGPGLGGWPETGELLEALFDSVRISIVVDADALNHLAKGHSRPRSPFLLTPHPGEAGRLLGIAAAEVQRRRFDSVRLLASKFAGTVLLKGAYTLIAEPGAPLWVNTTGNPGMAAPGMGDVLSGVIGSLLAKGLPPNRAAALGAYWHGLAGDLCAAEVGPAGYLASEVADMLPKARATIAST